MFYGGIDMEEMKLLIAEINGECRFPIENPDYESEMADYLYELCGEALHPLNGIPWFMEGSTWCFNGRSVGDTYEAEDEKENTLFRIENIEV